MKIKRILLLFIVIMIALSIKCFAAEEYPFDITTLVRDFNEHEYVKKLNSEGNKIYAVERTNRYTLRYNDLELTYTYNEEKKQLHTQIEVATNSTNDLLMLNALFIDTISTMQGKEPGSLMCFTFGNYYYSSAVDTDGIEKQYLQNSEGKPVYDFMINPYVRFIIPEFKGSITKEDFSREYKTLYEDTNTFIYSNDIVVLKYFDDTGKLVIYVGEPKEYSFKSKDSVKNLLELLVSEKAGKYFDKNISDLASNYESEALSVETNLDALPFTETRVLLMPHKMKYAKITIDKDKLKKLANEMKEEPEPSVGDSSKLANSKVPLITAIVIIGVVILILLFGILKRNHEYK